jgi:hypothetical protein
LKKLSSWERIWIAGVLVLGLCLGGKSYWLDSWTPHDSQEAAWMVLAQKALKEEPNSWFHENGILMDRIINIKEVPAEKAEISPILKVTVRSYVGGYLPMGDRKLTITQ